MRILLKIAALLAFCSVQAQAHPLPGTSLGADVALPPALAARLPATNAILAIAQSGSASGTGTSLSGCDGSGTNDTRACIQAYLDAMPTTGGVLNLGTGLYRIDDPLNISKPIIVVGSGGGKGQYISGCVRGLRAGAANKDLVILSASGSGIRSTCIDSGAGNTSGSAVKIVGPYRSVFVTDTQINNAFNGIAISGDTDGPSANATIANNVFKPNGASGGAAITVGAASTDGHTVDLFIYANVIYCGEPAAASLSSGMVFKDAGGPLVFGNAIYGCNVGTAITPGANQTVVWGHFNGTLLGDSSKTNDLLIDTQASTAQIRGTNFTGSWTSWAGGANVLIQDSGSSNNIIGLHFAGHRNYMDGNNIGFDVRAGTKFTIDASTICARGTSSGTAIKLSGSASDSAIRDNSIGVCEALSGQIATGISVVQSSAFVGIISGNDLSNSTTSLNLALTGSGIGNNATAVITDNMGLDNLSGSVTAAATVTLSSYPRFIINGSTTVTTINGGWGNRQITMIATSGTGLTFATGGNICNALTTTQNQMVTAYYDPGWGCWHMR